jgi:hypothetical protein
MKKNRTAQDTDVIARAAVNAGLQVLQDRNHGDTGKFWLLNESDIIQLGST